MPQPFSPLAAILKQTRALVGTPGRSGSDLMPVLRQVLAFHASEQGDEAHLSRLESELAYTLAAVMDETGDMAVLKLCLKTLFGLGVLGGMLVLAFMEKNRVSRESFANLMGRFPAHQRLMLVNRFFQTPRGEPRDLAWAFATVREIQGQDPEEALLFLERAADFGEDVAWPMQRELLRGQFGLWLEELLKLPLSEEQVRYMARTCGRLSSDALAARLGRHLKAGSEQAKIELLEAFSRCGSKGNEKVVKAAALFLRHKSPAIRMASVRAMLRLAAPQAVDALALLFAQAPALASHLHGLVFGLDDERLSALAKKLDSDSGAALPLALAAAVAAFDPQQAAALAAELASGETGGKAAAAKALAAMVAGVKAAPPGPAWTPPAYKRRAPAPEEDDAGGFFAKIADRLLSRDNDLPAGPQAVGADFLLAPAKDQKVAARTAKHVAAVGLTFEGGRYDKIQVSASVFVGCLFSRAVFVRCKFSGVDFGGCEFASVVFQDCEFANCSFADASLSRVGLEGCRLRHTCLASARLDGLSMRGCRVAECDFWGARFQDPAVEATAFSAAHFGSAALEGGRLEGVEFSDCRFQKTFMRAVVVRNADVSACSFQDSLFFDLDSDEPAFLLQEHEARTAALAALARQQPAPGAQGELASSYGLVLLHQFLERFFFAWTMKRRGGVGLWANRRRLRWCAAKLGPEGGEFLKMLPALVEAPFKPEGRKSFVPAPACKLAGYVPDLTTRGLLDKHLDAKDPAKAQAKVAEAASEPVPLEALYTIGSVGTIAQSGGSDIDMWLCYDQAKVSGEAMASLRDKLTALEAWAEARFGLEIHFFPMDMPKIRANDFGLSDKESAGSTQALLLKEEFYRTLVLLAGGKPAWWFFLPGAPRRHYDAGLERLASLPACYDAVDLGWLGEIPKEEFFGASLWQIVKALKSPFKSVMKFALLDKYIAVGDVQVLLCDRIKQSLLEGRSDFWSVDAYAVLFGEVYTHYKDAGNDQGRKLMRLAFEEKTGFNPLFRTTGKAWDMRGMSYIEWFFPHATTGMECELSGCGAAAAPEDGPSFARQMALGDQVAGFMFTTYGRIQKLIVEAGASAMVTQEDMTKLGRKIFGYFKPRKNKVMHIPFVASPKGMFSSLELACEGLPGTPMTWIVRGEHARKEGKKAALEEIRRDKDPVALMVWLAANQIYSPGLMVNGSNLQAPVSVTDVSELLDVLAKFFPPREVFDTPIEDSLKAEEARRALVVMNFLAAREDRRVMDVNLVYGTNWGELFCVSQPKDKELLLKSPRRFIQANVAGIIGPDMQVDVYTPHRSLAPKVATSGS